VPPTSPLLDEVKPDHPVREALEDADAERRAGGLGKPGKPLNARSPFMVGMMGALGVAVTNPYLRHPAVTAAATRD